MTRGHRDATLAGTLATFRDRYAEQLDALWSALGRVGQTHERVAPLLARDSDERVARLVQSAAFAAAYADTRADNESEHLVFPALARAIVDVTRPRPAATIVALTHENPTIRREKPGGMLTARGGLGARFVTCWPADYTPIRIAEARVIRPQPSLQVLFLTLEVSAGVAFRTALGETLRFFVDAPFALDLVHSLRRARGKATAHDARGKTLLEIPLRDAVKWVRVDTEEPPLVASRSAFRSTTLLSDLLVFPESFSFFDVTVGPLRAAPEKTTRLTVELELEGVVPAVETIRPDDLRLACSPAVNVFDAAMERTLGPNERAVVLQVPSDPLAEILDVTRVTCGDARFVANDVPLYEKVTPGDVLLGGVHARLRRSPSVVGDRVDVEMSFFSKDHESEAAPSSQLRCELIATQRHACLDLGRGDVRSIGAVNVARVARGAPVRWGREIAWRHNAYARMPCSELGGRASALEAFLSLHDPSWLDGAAIPPRIASAACSRGERLVDGAVQHGLHFTVEVDTNALGGPGAAWLTGELVARALLERDDRVRYTRLRWGPPGALHDFGPREGRLLPTVLG